MIKMYNEELKIKQNVHNETQADAFKKFGFVVVEEYPEEVKEESKKGK